MIADSLQAGALLTYICQHPAEDDARLALADVLEERGEDERAALIRVQVELESMRRDSDEEMRRPGQHAGRPCRHVWPEMCAWCRDLARREREIVPRVQLIWQFLACEDVTFRRGFIAEVSLPAASFAGGPCGRCEGAGVVSAAEWPIDPVCPDCGGTGRTPGHAAALFRAAPVEQVTLDREPHRHAGGYAWYYCDRDVPLSGVVALLPMDLFRLLSGKWGEDTRWIIYPTRQRALDALAAAALLLGRRRGWPCPRCQGSGKVLRGLQGVDEDQWHEHDCPDCEGRGHTVTA